MITGSCRAGPGAARCPGCRGAMIARVRLPGRRPRTGQAAAHSANTSRNGRERGPVLCYSRWVNITELVIFHRSGGSSPPSDTHYKALTCGSLFRTRDRLATLQVTCMGVQLPLGHQPFAHTTMAAQRRRGRPPRALDRLPDRTSHATAQQQAGGLLTIKTQQSPAMPSTYLVVRATGCAIGSTPAPDTLRPYNRRNSGMPNGHPGPASAAAGARARLPARRPGPAAARVTSPDPASPRSRPARRRRTAARQGHARPPCGARWPPPTASACRRPRPAQPSPPPAWRSQPSSTHLRAIGADKDDHVIALRKTAVYVAK